MIEFTIEGVPVAKGRPRFRTIFAKDSLLELAKQVLTAVRGGSPITAIMKLIAGSRPIVQTYTPPETEASEQEFGWKAKKYAPRQPFAGPLRVDLVFVMKPPVSLPADRSKRWPHVKPDVDNLFKLPLDAMNGMFWYDDAQVCACTITKVYGSPARTEVRIQSLGEADETQAALWGGTNG